MGDFYRIHGEGIPKVAGRPLEEKAITYTKIDELRMKTRPPVEWIRGVEITTGVGQFFVVELPDKANVKFTPTDGTAYIQIVHDGASWTSTFLEISQADLSRIKGLSHTEPTLMTKHAPRFGYHRLDWMLFSERIGPLDVSQGDLGNCRVASALQAIANSPKGPDLLRRLITKEGDDYAVTLKVGGGPKTEPRGNETTPERVSGYLPWCEERNGPLYMQKGAVADRTNAEFYPGRDPAVLWPAIIEKALAQRWGGYQELDGAEERVVFLMLGLTETFTLNWQSNASREAAFQAQILEKATNGVPMTTNSSGKPHNYALLLVDADGVVVSDPNSRDKDLDGRFDHPDTTRSDLPIPEAAFFPRRYTWQQFFRSFNWVYGAHIPG